MLPGRTQRTTTEVLAWLANLLGESEAGSKGVAELQAVRALQRRAAPPQPICASTPIWRVG